jgi:type VI secretion system protein ImpH
MASPDRQTTDPVIERLATQPFAFDFFRAVRLIESRHPDRPRIGCSASPSADPVRFAQLPSLAFAPSTIASFGATAPGRAPRLAVRCFGLFGPNAPLPPHLTEYAIERQRHHGDHTLAAFLNVFHHRLISFFYRAWAANQMILDLDRPDEPRYATFIGSFFGIGMPEFQHRDAVPDAAKLYFAGRLACQARNAEGLEAILGDFFAVPAQVRTFQGRWLDLPPDSVCRLGDSVHTGSVGSTLVVGSKFYDRQLSFRVRLGPMTLADLRRLLPDGRSFPRLQCWVRHYCGDTFIWDVQLVLAAAEVPATCLGRAGQLGWTTWLKTRPFAQDATDVILQAPRTEPASPVPTPSPNPSHG